MQLKHTPGEWAIDPYSDKETIAIYVAEGERHICTLEERGYGEEFREGDAALIKAAPELYEVVQELARVKRAGVSKKLMEDAQAALAKVTGADQCN